MAESSGERRPYTTGNAAVDAQLAALVRGFEDGMDRRLLSELLISVYRLGLDRASTGDLKILNAAVWFERQRMSFPIRKAWEGTYYLLNIEGKPLEMAKFRRELQISERVLRFLIIKAEEKKV